MTKNEMLARMQQIIDAAYAEGRDLTDAEQKEFDGLQAKVQAVQDDDAATVAKKAVEAERTRVAEINQICRTFGMDATNYIANGVTVEGCRKSVMDELAKNSAPISVKVTADEGEKFRAAAVDGFRMKSMNMNVQNAADGASEFRGMSLKDLARECMERDGMDPMKVRRMSDDSVLEYVSRTYMNPSAAFPAILDQTIRKNIVDIYQATPTTFELWTKQGTLSDFKQAPDHNYVLGGLSDFEQVPEGGEIKQDVPQTELLPIRQLKTYGKQFTMSREAFINDDIGFLAAVPGKYAQKAKDTIDNQVYQIVLSNGRIFDGKPLFAKDHNNLAATGVKPGIDGLKAMYLMMGSQMDQFGQPITITPKFVIVSNADQFGLYTALHSTQVTGTNNNDVNPFYGAPIQTIVTNKIDAYAGTNATPWFVVADQMSAPSIEVDYLNGNTTPVVRRMEEPGRLGYVWDMYLDWGITVTDFRGIYKNGGAK